jgi:hypothetical protein
MITEPVPAPSQDMPKPRRSRQTRASSKPAARRAWIRLMTRRLTLAQGRCYG